MEYQYNQILMVITVETPNTPESELIITDITKGIEDGKNIIKEDELVDSQS